MRRTHHLLLIALACVSVPLATVATASAMGLAPARAGGGPPVPSNRDYRPAGVTSPTGFVPVAPCRILDTRAATAGPLTTSASRVVQVTGSTGFSDQGGKATGCGVPAEASAISVSLTSTNAQGSGFLRAWAHGAPAPTATVMSWAPVGKAGITTGATLPISTKIDVKAFSNATDLIIDVTGYYVEPITALVSSSGDLVGWSKSVVFAGRLGTGTYQLQASRDVSGCTMSATPNDVKAKAVGYAIQKNIYVIISNASTEALVNDDFTVSVTC